MADVVAQLPALRLQLIPLREPARNLLIDLRRLLESPPPDAVFIYGIEGWLPYGPEAERYPFILNLNATRNHFPKEVPIPLVFWVPPHILTTLARGAADFCSVRSGIYSFFDSLQIRDRTVKSLTSNSFVDAISLRFEEKSERFDTLSAMLNEYETLPPTLRDPLAEARILNALANILYSLAEFETAVPIYRYALEIRESSLGPDHPDTATSLNNLAVLYSAQGRDAEAEPLHLRALEIRESSLGPDHPDTAASLNNLAILYSAQGRDEEAEPLHLRALEIRESSLGPDHPDTAASLNNLAVLYSAQGRDAEVEPLLRRALEIRESSLGPDHPDTAASLNNLAVLFSAQGRDAEAEPLYLRALEIQKGSLGPDHPDTAESQKKVMNLYESQGRYDEAEPLYRHSLAVIESLTVEDKDLPEIAVFFGNYADLLHKLGRNGEETRMRQRVKAVLDAHAKSNGTASDQAASK